MCQICHSNPTNTVIPAHRTKNCLLLKKPQNIHIAPKQSHSYKTVNCWFCFKKPINGRLGNNPDAKLHTSMHCKHPMNEYSPHYCGNDGMPNHYCSLCKCETHFEYQFYGDNKYFECQICKTPV